MGNEKRIVFDPFCLDLVNECLWRDSRAIKLRPKAFTLLAYLVARPGQLVTKEELLNGVWPETFIGDAILKVTIRQLREALDDDPKTPRFIETAHRRGYRFIGQIAESDKTPIFGSPRIATAPRGVVGRDEALSCMQRSLENMLRGERQIVFVTGEAGIGKTTLVDTFVGSIGADRSIRIGRGQCLEQYGTGEAFLPVLEAIGRLCREQEQVLDVLRAHAPMWLLQMPSLVSASDREVLSREVLGASRERMLREMGEALEALTAREPLVLILEDLHWSDYSTLDLITYLAGQREAAQLMVIGTYRMVELILSGHPLKAVKRELLAKQQCEELPLEYLSEGGVAEYLSVRFPSHGFPMELAELIHERTEGNPLFMVNAVDYLVAGRVIAESDIGRWQLALGLEQVQVGVPDSIVQMIEKQLEHLDADDQRTLEGASVAGAEFSVPAVVAALREDRGAVEARIERLTRQRQFLRDCGVHELPNGETVNRYDFIHALYRNVLYERMAASRRALYHRQMAEVGEVLYGERVAEIATELAMHFERCRDHERAARYLRLAAENAMRRFAYRDAVGLSRRGLELLGKMPDTPERAAQELSLQLTLGVPLIATEGYAAPDVGGTYLKARALCQQLGEPPEVAEALWGVWTFYMLRGAVWAARDIAEELLRLAASLPYPGLAMRGHWAMEITSMHMGEFAPALEHFENALLLYDPAQHLDDAFRYALNPGVAMPCFAACALWFLGQPDRALDRIREALTVADRLNEPHGLAHALCFAAIVHQLRREAHLAQERAEAVLAVSSDHGLVMYQAMATIIRGWALFEQGVEDEKTLKTQQMRQGLAALQATGTNLMRPHYAGLLAEALGRAGRPEEGLRLVEEALELAELGGEGCYLAELYRIQGELFLMQAAGRGLSRAAAHGEAVTELEPPDIERAESCFTQSIEIAREQQARSLELRTVMSLARHYRTQGRPEEARGVLEQVYSTFTEGFDTADLVEAKALLDELG